MSLDSVSAGKATFGPGRGRGRAAEGKGIAVLERSNVIGGFVAVRIDLQQIKFEDGDRVRQEFGERAVSVGTQLRFAGVLKNVRQPAGDIGKEWKAPAA